MSEQTKKIGFGFQDDTDDNLKGKLPSGKFGLNQGVFLSKFSYNPNAGKDNSQADAIDIAVLIGDREHNMRIYDITKVYDKDGNEIADKTSEDYIKAYNSTWTQNSAVVTHILKAFRTEEDIKKAFSSNLSTFAEWAKVAEALLPAGFQKQPIDVFLEYQWNISEGQDRTYLQLPRNMKGGYWFYKAQPGVFKEDRSTGDLKYVNEGGTEHPFTRSSTYLESNKAKQQVEGTSSGSAIEAPKTAGTPRASTW